MHAQSNLGFMYEHGQGVARDEARAVHWYRHSADNWLAVPIEAGELLYVAHAEDR